MRRNSHLPPAHRATTANLQALYPFVFDGGFGLSGILVGRDVFAGPFFFDPWELYRLGHLTSPNVLVMGQLGRGKSTFIKTLVWRHRAAGRRAWIVDPKGEYGALATACGTGPIRLVPGGPVRLNPLDFGRFAGNLRHPLDTEGAVRAGVELVSSLLEASLGHPLRPEERTAIELAVRHVSTRSAEPTLSHLVDALLDPEEGSARTVGYDRTTLLADGRAVGLELRRMVRGDLAGLFDGPTTVGVDLDGPLTVMDLSATFASPALPLVMTCATAWLQSVLISGQAANRLVVMDEAWAVLSDLATARWTQAAFKLSRAYGISNVIVVHRVSDLRAAGADGSTQAKLADGLLADTETRVVFGQSPSEAELTGAVLGLSRAEVGILSGLGRGFALWRVGGRPFLVEHLVGAEERSLVDTDAAMRGSPGAAGPSSFPTTFDPSTLSGNAGA